jgi:hypothetical protein
MAASLLITLRGGLEAALIVWVPFTPIPPPGFLPSLSPARAALPARSTAANSAATNAHTVRLVSRPPAFGLSPPGRTDTV